MRNPVTEFDTRLAEQCQEYDLLAESLDKARSLNASEATRRAISEELKGTRLVIIAYEILHRDHMKLIR